MTELIKLIYDTLSAVGTTFLEDALQGTDYPYITFYLQTSFEDYQRERFVLEVNVWDNQDDTTRLEQMVTDIDALLHRMKHYEKDVLQTSIYRESRQMIPDPDPTIRRRRLVYECKTYIR
jgi:hypothetical protein